MAKTDQLEFFKIESPEKPKFPKRKMGILGGNMREFIKETKIEHTCAGCGKLIEKGSQAVKLAPLVRSKPDITKIEYFHPSGTCPE